MLPSVRRPDYPATGRIRLPAGVRTLFLPQRPYMPIGTLRQALWFPAPPAVDGDAEARAALGAGAIAQVSKIEPLFPKAA